MSKDWQTDVIAFQLKFGGLINDTPAIPDQKTIDLRMDLLEEEVEELSENLRGGNLVKTADALGDIMYVVIGTAISCGINLQPIWDEVHRTNMLKEGGGRRDDGKVLKPKGWKPPNIEKLLEEQCKDFGNQNTQKEKEVSVGTQAEFKFKKVELQK